MVWCLCTFSCAILCERKIGEVEGWHLASHLIKKWETTKKKNIITESIYYFCPLFLGYRVLQIVL